MKRVLESLEERKCNFCNTEDEKDTILMLLDVFDRYGDVEVEILKVA